MSWIHRRLAIALMSATMLCASTSSAGADDGLKKDLFSVITLRGKPCGAVVSATKMGENDYVVECKTGDRYRVYLGNGGKRVKVDDL